MWLFNFFLVGRTLKQELQGKQTNDISDQGEFDHHTFLHHQAVLHILLLPCFPPISSSSLSFFYSLSFSFSGKYQNCHLVLKSSLWFFLVLILVLFSSVFGCLVIFQNRLKEDEQDEDEEEKKEDADDE